MGIVMVDNVAQSLEAPIMVEASLVCRIHEQPFFTNEDACQVHRLVYIVGSPVRLEAVNANICGWMQIPSRLGPQRLHMAIAAFRFAVEQLVPTRCGSLVKVYPCF